MSVVIRAHFVPEREMANDDCDDDGGAVKHDGSITRRAPSRDATGYDPYFELEDAKSRGNVRQSSTPLGSSLGNLCRNQDKDGAAKNELICKLHPTVNGHMHANKHVQLSIL